MHSWPSAINPRLHHVGLIVQDLEQAIRQYRALGFPEPELHDIDDQGVRVATFSTCTGFVELIMPVVDEGGLVRYLESRGEGIHHVAYAVDDIEQSLRELEQSGFELIDQQPRIGANNWHVAFIHPRSCFGVLTELVQVDEIDGSGGH